MSRQAQAEQTADEVVAGPVSSAEAAVMAEQDRRLVLAAVGRLPVRTREILATAGRPGLFTPSPDRRYLLQQIRRSHTSQRG